MLDGEIKFELYGYKLRGAFTLVHTGKGKRGRVGARLERLAADQEARQRQRSSPAIRAVGRVACCRGSRSTSCRARAGTRVVAELAELGREAPIAPGSIEPMLCQTAERAFSSDDWIFELKYDGFRMLGVRRRGPGDAALSLRAGPDRSLSRADERVRALPIPGLVLDGEIVMLDADGKPDFHKLAFRGQMHRTSRDPARGDGGAGDVRRVRSARRRRLRSARPAAARAQGAARSALLPAIGPLRYGRAHPAQGEALLAQVVARGLEGVVAKQADSPYR